MRGRTVVQRAALLLLVAAPAALAQAVVSSGAQPLAPSSATVVIVGTFDLMPAAPALVQLAQQGPLCNPGACFSGSALVRANQTWVAQVRIRPGTLANATAAWIPPGSRQAVPLTSAFVTIAAGAAPSTGTPLGLMFSANRANGHGGATPTAAQLSSALEFRVVGAP